MEDKSKTRFLSVSRKKTIKKKDTDYDVLERSVKYIPWKGKKEEWYTWHKMFLVRAMTRSYHGILVGLESVPRNEVAKTLMGLTEITSVQKKKFNNYKLNIRDYKDLLQCCTQDIVSFGIIHAAKDKELSKKAIQHLRGNVYLRNLRNITMQKK